MFQLFFFLEKKKKEIAKKKSAKLLCNICGFSGVDLTADSLMDRLDNGILLCELAHLLQEKMIRTNNGKVLQKVGLQRGLILWLTWDEIFSFSLFTMLFNVVADGGILSILYLF